MSVDYLARLEQQRGPQPSDQMLAAIARGLRLTQMSVIICFSSRAVTRRSGRCVRTM